MHLLLEEGEHSGCKLLASLVYLTIEMVCQCNILQDWVCPRLVEQLQNLVNLEEWSLFLQYLCYVFAHQQGVALLHPVLLLELLHGHAIDV